VRVVCGVSGLLVSPRAMITESSKMLVRSRPPPRMIIARVLWPILTREALPPCDSL